MYSIGITILKRRYDFAYSLLKQIREYRQDVEVPITVNADYDEPFDRIYRKNTSTNCR